MRSDIYTKVILTAIALFLGVIAFRPVFSPDSVAHAQGSFAGVQAVGNSCCTFFDSRTGDYWFYGIDKDGIYKPYKSKLTKLGQDMPPLK